MNSHPKSPRQKGMHGLHWWLPITPLSGGFSLGSDLNWLNSAASASRSDAFWDSGGKCQWSTACMTATWHEGVSSGYMCQRSLTT